MNNGDARNYEMMVRVEHFGERHAVDFPATSLGGKAFAELAAVIREVEHQFAVQTTSSGSGRSGTVTRATARTALRETLSAINITGRAVAIDSPGLEEKFRMPHSGDQALLTAARGFLEAAAPLKDQFIQHEMDANFLEDLTREIDALQAAVAGQHSDAETRVRATASLDALIDRGMKAVLRLDAIVRNKFRDDPATLSAWASARHVERHSPRTTDQPKSDPTHDTAAGAASTSQGS